MKAYADLEQSKKLAEILPIESADMCYLSEESLIPKVIYNGMAFFNSKEERLTNVIHCWSLAALLGVLPDHFYDKTGRKTLGMDKGDTYYNIFYENKNSYIKKSADNPVDACYEMIIVLHEQKLL